MMIALLWMGLLVAIYIGTYIWNKRTPRPEGCEELKECNGCHNIACSLNQAHKEGKL